uniref:Uncharacterized protein n=1 Tax=Anguilla anguilla TaxID=7936 RepID=A0A0E9RI15_ANGAN
MLNYYYFYNPGRDNRVQTSGRLGPLNIYQTNWYNTAALPLVEVAEGMTMEEWRVESPYIEQA